MTSDKFNSKIPNNEVGLYFTRSRRVVVGTKFSEIATWIKAGTAGDVVWYNSELDEYGIWTLEAGEVAPIACDTIVASHVIDGILETTTATGLQWATCSPRIGKEKGD